MRGVVATSAADLVHGTFGLYESRSVDAMPPLFRGNAVTHELDNFLVASARSQQSACVPFRCRKQTISQLSIGGDPQAIAVAAKRLADWIDKADAAHAIGKFK